MISAAPLIKNDPRLKSLVERLKTGESLIQESKAMGYSHHVQLRNVLKELIGVEAYAALMSGRAKMFSKNVRTGKKSLGIAPIHKEATLEAAAMKEA
jgi:hypothetical protein